MFWNCFNVIDLQRVNANGNRRRSGTYTDTRQIVGLLYCTVLYCTVWYGMVWCRIVSYRIVGPATALHKTVTTELEVTVMNRVTAHSRNSIDKYIAYCLVDDSCTATSRQSSDKPLCRRNSRSCR